MSEHIRLINKTEDYIELNLAHKITLDTIAKHLHMSKYHFHRIFSTNKKESITQFINRIKLERSAIYLKVNQTNSITNIAYSYGYCDASAYCKAFKKHFNITPTQYRKQQDYTIINLKLKL